MELEKLTPTISLNKPLQSRPTYQAKSSSQDHVAHLSRTVIELLNGRDFDNPWFSQNVSRDVRVDVQGNVNIGLGGFIGNYKAHASHAEDFQCVIGNVTAVVDERQGTGTAILSQYLSGYQGDERRMAGTILMSWSWNSTRGRWICRSVTMMLGTPVFLTNDIYAAV